MTSLSSPPESVLRSKASPLACTSRARAGSKVSVLRLLMRIVLLTAFLKSFKPPPGVCLYGIHVHDTRAIPMHIQSSKSSLALQRSSSRSLVSMWGQDSLTTVGCTFGGEAGSPADPSSGISQALVKKSRFSTDQKNTDMITVMAE